MANTSAFWDIVDLTVGTEQGVDTDVENLRVAASRAQHAASRYLEQAVGLESVTSVQGHRGSLSSQLKQDDVDLVRGTSGPAKAVTKAFFAQEIQLSNSVYKQNSHNDMPQGISWHVGDTGLPKPHPNAADSGLGESVSETEDSSSPINSLSSHARATTVSTFGTKNLESAQRFKEPLPLQDAAGKLQQDPPRPNITIPRKAGISQHTEQGSPSGRSESDLTTLGNPRGSQLNSSATNDEHPSYQTQPDRPTPKKKGGRPRKSSPSSHPYRKCNRESRDDVPALRAGRSPMKEMNKVSSQNKGRYGEPPTSQGISKVSHRSLPRLGSFGDSDAHEVNDLTSSVYQPPLAVLLKRNKPEESLWGVSSLAEKGVKRQKLSRKSLENALSLSCGNDTTLAGILKEIVYPALEAAIEGRRGLLPEGKLISIAKTVARKVADNDFRIFLKQGNYRLDRRQKKMIKRTVEDLFGQEALLVYTKHQPNSNSNPFQGEERNSRVSLPKRHNLKPGSELSGDKNLERLHISTSAPTSYDMSLLGPGESCPSPALVAASVGSHHGPPASSEPSHTNSNEKVKKIRRMPPNTTPSRGTFSQRRETKLKDLDPLIYDIESIPIAPPPGFHNVRQSPFVEGSAIPASKAQVVHESPKVSATVNTDIVVESSALRSIPNKGEHDSLVKGAVDHASSRYRTTGGSRSSSPDSRSSMIGKVPDGNGFDYGQPQHGFRKDLSVNASVSQLQSSKHWAKANTQKSRPASSYTMTRSPVSKRRELGLNLDVSHSARQRPAPGYVDTPSELVRSWEDQRHTSKVNDLVITAEYCSSVAPQEKYDMQQNDRQQLLDYRHVYKGEQGEEAVDLRTWIVPQAMLTPGQAFDLRNPVDESIRKTEQTPLKLHQSFRPQDHKMKRKASPPQDSSMKKKTSRVDGLNRRNNRVARSPKQGTSARSRALHRSAQGILGQSARQVHRKTSGDASNTERSSNNEPSTPFSFDPAIDMGQIPSQIEEHHGKIEGSTSDSLSNPTMALPTAHDPLLSYVAAGLVLHDPRIARPYVESNINPCTLADEHGGLKHVDFSHEECKALSDSIGIARQGTGPYPPRVQANLKNTHPGRDDDDIISYFTDLQNDTAAAKPGFKRVEHVVVNPTQSSHRSISSTLRHRELGLNTMNETRGFMSSMLHPWRSWRGASGDVVACAWGPESVTYAAGAAAHVNPEDQQYNRSCNLLLGDLITNKLQELPDHRVARPHTTNMPTVSHNTEELYNVLDPMLYKTVTSVQFSTDGSKLYTASHDSTVKVWDVSRRMCLDTLDHEDHVTSLEVCKTHEGVFATASKTIDNSIRVYFPSYGSSYEDLKDDWAGFSSSRAQQKRSWEIYPECIRWGLTPLTNHLLLAGFQQWQGHEGPPPAREGQLCLFDLNKMQPIKVSPSSQSVHSIAWHPILDLFATGGAAGRGLLTNRHSTKTVVRSWDLRSSKSCAMEYECTAIDIQDITFHPRNSNYITASCTDGSIYVWDFRKPNQRLHRLQHGIPMMDLDPDYCREEQDAGVLLTTWDEHGNSLFTGSSDGMIKEWDVLRAPENALVRDVAQIGAGVQNGAFSPDFTNLLVGDAAGAVHVFSSAPIGPEAYEEYDDEDKNIFIKKTMPIEFVAAVGPAEDDENPGVEGVLASNERLGSHELVVHRRYGAGQGPRYRGPYARWARTTIGNGVGFGQLTPEVEESRLATAAEKKAIVQERRAMLEDDKLYQRLQGMSRSGEEHEWWCGCLACGGE